MSEGPFKESQLYENIYEESTIKQNSQFKPPKHSYIQMEKYESPFFNDHMEQEYVIQRAFQSNNFTYLRNLPNQFKRGVILDQRKDKVVTANQSEGLSRTKPYEEKYEQNFQKIKQKKKQQIGTLGYFNIFPYQQSNYDMQHILLKQQNEKNIIKRQAISIIDFRPSGFDTKMKYQDPFLYIDKIFKQQNKNQEYIFPFHLPGDTYDAFQESERRKKIVSDSLKLAGDFIPSQQQQTLRKANKSLLGEIVNEIQIFLKKYLKDIGFFIGVNRKDHVEVLFEEKYKDERKIYMLMSKICEHQMLSKYLLRRNLKQWGISNSENRNILFCMLPNWVKNPQQSLSRLQQSTGK